VHEPRPVLSIAASHVQGSKRRLASYIALHSARSCTALGCYEVRRICAVVAEANNGVANISLPSPNCALTSPPLTDAIVLQYIAEHSIGNRSAPNIILTLGPHRIPIAAHTRLTLRNIGTRGFRHTSCHTLLGLCALPKADTQGWLTHISVNKLRTGRRSSTPPCLPPPTLSHRRTPFLPARAPLVS
jgi:hypothetical protein